METVGGVKRVVVTNIFLQAVQRSRVVVLVGAVRRRQRQLVRWIDLQQCLSDISMSGGLIKLFETLHLSQCRGAFAVGKGFFRCFSIVKLWLPLRVAIRHPKQKPFLPLL